MTTIKTLSDRDHVLLRPGMYIGNTHMIASEKYLLEGDRLVKRDIVYNPALERLFLEVFYNALDNCERSRTDNVDPGKIHVVVRNDTVLVKNEGNPFPIGEEDSDGMYQAERALGVMKSGSNFDDSSRQVGGTNGCGSKATNIFSLLFDVDICNGIEKKRLKMRWTNNMALSTKTIEDYEGPSSTKITYIVDFSRFYDSDVEHGYAGMREYSEHMIDLFGKHCVDGALTAGVPVIFNKKVIRVPDLQSYARFLTPEIDTIPSLSFDTDDTKVLIFDASSCEDKFRDTLSFVNGICVGGGVHIDAWQKKIVDPLRPAFKKLGLPLNARNAHKNVFKSVAMIMVCRYSHIEFSEQVKDKLTSPKPDVPILNTLPMTKWECIKDMARRLLALKTSMDNVSKKNDGKKSRMCAAKKLSDASEAGGKESHLCTLYVCEGDSASALAEKYIDGRYNGSLPLQGKPLNVSKCNVEDYDTNEEIIALKQALGLKEGVDYSDDTEFSQLRYGRLVSLTDQDVDGAGHIVGLLFNFLRKRYPSLLERAPSFFNVFETPLMKVKCGNKKLNFFSAHEYKKWLVDNDFPDHDCSYLKGLGSNDDEEIDEAFEKGRLRDYIWDDDAEDNLSMAFDDENSDSRKEWVLSYDQRIGLSSYAHQYDENTISYFINSHLCEYSHTNTQRSIPSIVDSMKECNRKILSVALNLKDPIAVTDFKGSVKTKTSYKYGDHSLYGAIVNMANVCIGTNNINLLRGKGQFDSRKGKTAAQDRYIKAGPSQVLPYLFRKEDSILLEKKYDEGKEIEPHHYYPILPLFAINGVSAIATGFSSSSPARSTVDVMKWVIWWIKKHTGEEVPIDPPVLKPHYNNYQGKIYHREGKGWYSEGAYAEIPSRKLAKDIHITELPITLTISSYLNKLTKIISKLPNSSKVQFKSTPSSRRYTYKGEKRIEILPNITISGFVPQTDNILKELGLIEKIPKDSLVLLDENSVPKVYGSDIDSALSDFCIIRYDAYERRRQSLIKMWREKIDTLRLRQKYIREVVDGTISFRILNKPKTKNAILKDLSDRGYPADFIKMSISMLTTDGLDSVDRQIKEFQDQIDRYENATAKSLWLDEIKELHSYLYK